MSGKQAHAHNGRCVGVWVQLNNERVSPLEGLGELCWENSAQCKAALAVAGKVASATVASATKGILPTGLLPRGLEAIWPFMPPPFQGLLIPGEPWALATTVLLSILAVTRRKGTWEGH